MRYATLHDVLRSHIYNQKGIVDHKPIGITPFNDVVKQMHKRLDWIFQMCFNRIALGHYRYGDNNSKVVFSYTQDIERTLKKYESSGNIDFLFDTINYCELEINFATDPKKHFSANDDTEHSRDSLGTAQMTFHWALTEGRICRLLDSNPPLVFFSDVDTPIWVSGLAQVEVYKSSDAAIDAYIRVKFGKEPTEEIRNRVIFMLVQKFPILFKRYGMILGG